MKTTHCRNEIRLMKTHHLKMIHLRTFVLLHQELLHRLVKEFPLLRNFLREVASSEERATIPGIMCAIKCAYEAWESKKSSEHDSYRAQAIRALYDALIEAEGTFVPDGTLCPVVGEIFSPPSEDLDWLRTNGAPLTWDEYSR
jgi:hypothetical protein